MSIGTSSIAFQTQLSLLILSPQFSSRGTKTMKRLLALLLSSSVLASVPLAISPRVLAQFSTSAQTTLEAVHPNGTSLQLADVKFTKTNISLNLTAVNRSSRKIQLNSTKGMVLIDNLGNRYFMEPPETNRYLAMNPGKTSQGWLTFRGGLAPQATSLMLVTNSRRGLKTDPTTQYPLLTLQIPIKQTVTRGQTAPSQPRRSANAGWVTPPSYTIHGRKIQPPTGNFDIRLRNGARLHVRSPNVSSSNTHSIRTNRISTASATAPVRTERAALSYSEQGLKVQHPNGTVLQVMGVRFAADRIIVNVAVVNRSPKTIKLNTNPQNLILIDNLGNQYDVIPAIDNPRVEVASYSTFNGDLTFATRLDSNATSLTLITNQEFHGLQRDTTSPRFVVALPLNR
ncbi:hypothetical protein C7B80_23640 [Cyanosarcina cf. burmensis CCALA 770]|nr:hypothetical protein C7B80_23640 [Cyanosarcina cf. burmensis CCALA 770]